MVQDAKVTLGRSLVVAAVLFASGCDSSKPGQGAPCSRVSDCATGLTCGYKVSDGCSAQGTCVPVTPQPGQAACGALIEYCGCDAVTPVTAGCTFFSDYAPAPVMPASGSCLPGTSTDAGRACSGWGEICNMPCCDGLVCMSSSSSALPSICVKS